MKNANGCTVLQIQKKEQSMNNHECPKCDGELKSNEFGFAICQTCERVFHPKYISGWHDGYAAGERAGRYTGRWISVQNSLPDVGVEVFCRKAGGRFTHNYIGIIKSISRAKHGTPGNYTEHESVEWVDSNGGAIEPEYWMPIPD